MAWGQIISEDDCGDGAAGADGAGRRPRNLAPPLRDIVETAGGVLAHGRIHLVRTMAAGDSTLRGGCRFDIAAFVVRRGPRDRHESP